MRILMISPEFAPLAKAGGLGDAVAALSRALADRGHDVRALMPRYYFNDRSKLTELPGNFSVPLRDGEIPAKLYATFLPRSEVRVYMLDVEDLFGRDGIYGSAEEPYFADNDVRAAVLSGAVAHLPAFLGWIPQVVHAHDWMAAPAMAVAHGRAATVLSIHNIAHQGVFGPESVRLFDYLPNTTPRCVSFRGQTNFLAGGVTCAEIVTTVSSRYRDEILTPEFGQGLEEILVRRSDSLCGILNGVDYDDWNPMLDHWLPFTFDVENREGKRKIKRLLQRELLLPVDDDATLIGMVGRIVQQKGWEHLIGDDGALARIVQEHHVQFAILGTGEAPLEAALHRLAKDFPNIRTILRFDERTAHMIEAASDFFLMPSLFEPCGLNQMYSLRYGAVPIVAQTGGLLDTVVDLATADATGIHIASPTSANTVADAVARAVRLRTAEPKVYAEVQARGMTERFTWHRSAAEYERAYHAAVEAATP